MKVPRLPPEQNLLQPQGIEQSEQSPIAEEPTALTQEYRVYPLGQREASLGVFTDAQLHKMCVSVVYQLTTTIFSEKNRM